MNKLHFVVSLTTNDNDYQLEQAAAAQDAAQRMGIVVTVLYAENDAITQSQQLLNAIQSADTHPQAIIVEPVGGTALPQVARAAVSAGISWAVLNRDAEYISELHSGFRVPIFALTSDHEEIGRIQGKQFAALLPKGGTVLYIQGPAESLAAKQRSAGMNETKPSNVQVKFLRGQWTETSSYKAVTSWLRLSTSQQAHIDLIAGQDDSMAMGARRAFEELPEDQSRRWLKLPFIGCDGTAASGQAWVRSGLLAATVVVPANSGQAVEMLVKALRYGSPVAERTLTVPYSFPSIDFLSSVHDNRGRSAGAH